MKFFIDSCIFIAAFNQKDIHHQAAKKILVAITTGKIKNIYLSDYVFDEVVTYLKKKMSSEVAIQASEALLNSHHLNFLYMNEQIFNATFHILKMYDDLSYTDSSIVVMMKNYQIQYVYSFDSGFDGVNDINRLTSLLI